MVPDANVNDTEDTTRLERDDTDAIFNYSTNVQNTYIYNLWISQIYI